MQAKEPTNPWLDAEVEELRQLVERSASSAEISQKLGRSISAVKAKISRIDLPPRLKPQKAWPKEETAHLLMLRDEMRLGWSEIANRMGRPSGTCYSKYKYVKDSVSKNKVEARQPIDTACRREWLHRQSLEPASLTAALCGDPLPGYSALDRRGA